METGLVAMVDNVSTTDMGQVSILDLSACQQLLIKLVMWFLLAHLYSLVGTAKSHSARPSLFGEAPASSVACGRSALRTWLVLCRFGLLSWFKCDDGTSEVAMSTEVAASKSAFYFTVQVTVALFLYHSMAHTRATTKDFHLNDIKGKVHNSCVHSMPLNARHWDRSWSNRY